MNELVLVFFIAALGYLVGRIELCGLRLGSSGVLLCALVFGHFGFSLPSLIQNLGLSMFVTAVGLIAGPMFFRNFKGQAFHYVMLGILIIGAGAFSTFVCMRLFQVPTDLSIGLMAGALTSTPGLAAAVEASGSDMASVGYGIAYPFGVIGVVLFVQLVPRILGADLKKEAELSEAEFLTSGAGKAGRSTEAKKGAEEKLLEIDSYGLFAFGAAALLGILIGQIRIPLPGGAAFSLGTSGGPLLSGLLFGHLGQLFHISLRPPRTTVKTLREFGLILFLMGAGLGAGNGFVEVLTQYGAKLFLMGAMITLIPMLLGFFAATILMHIRLLNALGSICGGMTSTPALGALISSAHTETASISYAATYPAALVFVVLFCELMTMFL